MSKLNIDKEDTTEEDASVVLRSLIEEQEVSPIHELELLSDLWPADDDPDLLLNFVLEERTERRRLHVEREQSK
jgi:hypothetical protein